LFFVEWTHAYLGRPLFSYLRVAREFAYIEENAVVTAVYLVGHPKAAVFCFYGFHALQLRGQEAAGVVSREWPFNARKGVGFDWKF